VDLNSKIARFNMIQQQIRPWDVLDDRVLDVMGAIPREGFVPDAYRGLAYADLEVPIGEGQAMLAPKVVARLLQALNVQPGDRVLEVGTGSGYLTACLRRLGASVVSLELDPALAAAARERLGRLGLDGIDVRTADALAGPAAGGPFDVIAVTGSVPGTEVLWVLEDQLALAGRLVCVLGGPPPMEAWLMTRAADGSMRRTALFETSIPALANCPEPRVFVF
jgi:protein-L-isoaspartate(D-aspartate) O-methyltransferase